MYKQLLITIMYIQLTDTIKTTTNELRDGQRRLLTDIGTRLSSLHVREQERDLLVERVKNINEQVQYHNRIIQV